MSDALRNRVHFGPQAMRLGPNNPCHCPPRQEEKEAPLPRKPVWHGPSDPTPKPPVRLPIYIYCQNCRKDVYAPLVPRGWLRVLEHSGEYQGVGVEPPTRLGLFCSAGCLAHYMALREREEIVAERNGGNGHAD